MNYYKLFDAELDSFESLPIDELEHQLQVIIRNCNISMLHDLNDVLQEHALSTSDDFQFALYREYWNIIHDALNTLEQKEVQKA